MLSGIEPSHGACISGACRKGGIARDFVSSVKDKRKDFDRSRKRQKIKREAWFIQQLPGSSTLIAFMETDDVEKAISDFAHSTDPFDIWLKDSARAITGIDLNEPRKDPVPETLLSYGF
ncbi:MAG TPA: hypothetical protein VED17_05985 [Nitrososphaerales archaeon]|nr:hypothetical protein [Nitrososphaerales archaeon]